MPLSTPSRFRPEFLRPLVAAAVASALVATPGLGRADDRIDFSTTLFEEKRRGDEGGLTVIHPELNAGIELGEHVGLDIGYSADVVSGATPAVFTLDAVSTATPFEDTRHEGRLGLDFHGRNSRLRFAGHGGAERDQTSIGLTTSATVYLPGRNTRLSLAYSHDRDEVCDRDNGTLAILERRPLSGHDPCEKTGLFGNDLPGVTVWRALRIDTSSVTLTQNLTPTLVAQLAVNGQVMRGFQANPYRRVRLRDRQPQEHLPDLRTRLTITTSIKKYLRSMRSVLHLTGRGYGDNWGVTAGSGELAYSQYTGTSLLWRARARLYAQGPADFFRDAYFYESDGESASHFTGDRELSRLRNITVGGKLSYLATRRTKKVWGWFDELRVNIKGDVLFYQELAKPDNAVNPTGIGRQFLGSDQVVDGFVVQLGLQLSY
jgi:hypothetical protein